MRILVMKDAVLDTKTGIIENSSTFDIDKIGCPVIFNVHDEGSEKYCDVCFGAKIAIHQKYEAVKQKVASLNPFEVQDTIESQSKAPKKATTSKPQKRGTSVKIDKDSMFTKDLSKEERDNIEAGNKVMPREGRIVYVSQMSLDRTEKGQLAREMILEAKQWLKRNKPFYYGILFNLDERYTEDNRWCPTLGVTPNYLCINPNFVTRLKPKELRFILMHEASHIIFKHPARLKKRNPDLWNIAGDIYINKAICEDLDITPDNPSSDVEFSYGGLYVDNIDLQVDTTDVIYDELCQEINSEKRKALSNMSNPGKGDSSSEGGSNDSQGQEGEQNESSNGNGGNRGQKDKGDKGQNGDNDLQGQGQTVEITFRGKKLRVTLQNSGDVMLDEGTADRDERELERKMSGQIRGALEVAKKAGHGHGLMERLFEVSEETPPPTWTRLLSPYLRPGQMKQFTYNKSYKNRITRMSNGKVIMKGGIRPPTKLKQLCIAIDGSGSIGQKEMKNFHTQAKGFLDERKNVEGWVCYWDTEIGDNGPFKNYKEFKAVGENGGHVGGGTNPECVFKWAKEQQCKYIIIFTDGYIEEPSKHWEKEFTCILWVIADIEGYKQFKPPFGKKCINGNEYKNIKGEV